MMSMMRRLRQVGLALVLGAGVGGTAQAQLIGYRYGFGENHNMVIRSGLYYVPSTYVNTGTWLTTDIGFTSNPATATRVAIHASLLGPANCGVGCQNLLISDLTLPLNRSWLFRSDKLPFVLTNPDVTGYGGVRYTMTYSFTDRPPSAAVIDVAFVPEPSTYALMATGLLAVGGIARRKRKA
jgi:hypothetical protein